ncbi:MAG TPA: tail fiber domain-containing protein, partial [Thermoanaerobaculia bacterium]|nr:tail fiber domain-containing protein [Thermoanaerobaculia bacterium]
LQAVEKLNPVKFQYKAEPDQQHVGFIAEDVPDLVAMKDRKSLSPMDVVAVLTKVVQEQQKTIEKLSARLTELEQTKK